MNELVIKPINQIGNNNFPIEKLKEFYNNIDVSEETIRTYKNGIDNFLNWIKSNNITLIEKQTLIDYKKYLKANYKIGTASTYLSGVRNLFNFLEEFGVPNLMRNIKGFKISKTYKKQPLTKIQANKILSEKSRNIETLKDARDFLLLNLLIFNGLRTIECTRANIDDLLHIDGQIILKIQGKGKTEKTEDAVLTDSVQIALFNYLDKRGKDNFEPLFISVSNNDYGSRLTTRSIRRIIKNILVSNGYNSELLTTHSLRHSAITFALKGGASLQDAKELARHSNINTTLIYSHNIDRLKNAPEYYIEKYLHSEDKQ